MTILSRSFFFLKVPAIRFRSLEQRRRRRRATRASPPSRRADSHFRRSLCWARKETATRQSISRIIGQPLHPFLPLQQLARARSSSGDPETILPFYPLRFNPSFRLLPTIETRNNARDLVASRFSSTRILLDPYFFDGNRQRGRSRTPIRLARKLGTILRSRSHTWSERAYYVRGWQRTTEFHAREKPISTHPHPRGI